MATSNAGKGIVYSFRTDSPLDQIAILQPQPTAPRTGMTPVLAADHWKLRNTLLTFDPPYPALPEQLQAGKYSAPDSSILKPAVQRTAYQYVSPDGTLFMPAGEDFVTGALYYGVKMADILRTFGLVKATPGHPFYITDEQEEKTYSANVDADGTLQNLKLFTDRGGESVITDAQGNVYIAAGQIYVYTPAGKLLETINVPERPINLIFGKDGRTLFILARTSLYSVQTGLAASPTAPTKAAK
jgi:hypothetical protein